jgi:large subunit ribosomal protein L10
MALSYAAKQAVVAEVSEVANTALSAVAAEYRGLSVEEMTTLRRAALDNGVYLRVVKNTLARRAIQGTDFECMAGELTGPLVLAFSQEDPGAAGRVIKEFAKESKTLVVRLVSIGGEVLPATDLEKLASLPNREQALAMLLGVMQAPITKFVRTLAEPTGKMVRTVAAVRAQKEAA